jgi:hypothetical protein
MREGNSFFTANGREESKQPGGMAMAGAAGRGSNVGERRRQRALEAFRNELADLDADEIQARLDAHRIRSAERRTIARQRLRMLRSEETAEAPGADERGDETGNEPEDRPGAGGEPRGDDIQSTESRQGAGRTAAEDAGSRKPESHEKHAGNGQDQPADAAVNKAGGEEVATEQDEAHALPLARQIGRFVGMTAAVGGVVLAGAWLIRR